MAVLKGWCSSIFVDLVVRNLMRKQFKLYIVGVGVEVKFKRVVVTSFRGLIMRVVLIQICGSDQRVMQISFCGLVVRE